MKANALKDRHQVDYEKVGIQLIEFLGLKTDERGHVQTDFGRKAPAGLAKAIERIYQGKY